MRILKSLPTKAALAFILAAATSTVAVGDDTSVSEYQKSLESSQDWELPESGPAAAKDIRVKFIAASLRNSGILGVAEGVTEAGKAIGWDVEVEDARGSDNAKRTLLKAALKSKPDALVIGGFDAAAHTDLLVALSNAGTRIVGWHAGPTPGPIAETPVFFNVTTDPYEVARVAAQHAIAQAETEVGAVIFTDDRFEIALAKSNEMKRLIEHCDTCRVLEVVNLRLDQTATEMPLVVDELLAKHGDAWSVSLGINDLYFDDAVVAFSLAGVSPKGQITNVSAGDGSLTAYQRIRLGNYQAATVPEPLNFQGWQIIDELNRAIAGERPSGFIAPTKLVLSENIDEDGGSRNIFDPSNGYREKYLEIWSNGS